MTNQCILLISSSIASVGLEEASVAEFEVSQRGGSLPRGLVLWCKGNDEDGGQEEAKDEEGGGYPVDGVLEEDHGESHGAHRGPNNTTQRGNFERREPTGQLAGDELIFRGASKLKQLCRLPDVGFPLQTLLPHVSRQHRYTTTVGTMRTAGSQSSRARARSTIARSQEKGFLVFVAL